eukprot:Skav228921  [mRNA]  locus=scaffold2504:147786:149014:+ [translate_table: standard]
MGAHSECRWEFLVQRSGGLRILCIEDVDLGSGSLEWLCKGLRSHQVRPADVCKLVGALCREEGLPLGSSHALRELDLSENPLGVDGAKEVAKALSFLVAL